MNPLIEFEHVTFAYPPLTGQAQPAALHEVSLHIESGEYVALVGANGSGKSTLARHCNALLRPQAGRVRVAGMDTRDAANRGAIHQIVGMVFQRPDDQIVATVVEEDVAFGPENLGLNAAEIRTRVDAALEATGLWHERQRPAHMLSAGQMQRLALAGVLAMQPRCIVFDEATAMLDPVGRRMVHAMLADLHRQGITVITITHFMEEALAARRVVVLEQGRIVRDAPPEVVFADPEWLLARGLDLPPVAALAQRLRACLPTLPAQLFTAPALCEALATATPPPSHESSSHPPAPTPLIEVRDLGHIYLQGTPLERRAIWRVSLTVGEGEVRGLAGATGSGKSTLLQHLNGLMRPQEGRVRVGEFEIGDPQTDLRAVRRAVGLSFQRPEQQIFEQYVGDEIAYGLRLQGLRGPALRERVRWAMEQVGLDFAAFKDRLTFALSGGERRKVALAATLALQPRVLLLDEPTAGLDPAARREVLAHLQRLCEAGMTLVISSHQMEDLALLTERLAVMAGGRMALDDTVAGVFAQGAALREIGLEPPVAALVAEGLRARGWLIPIEVITGEALAQLWGREN